MIDFTRSFADISATEYWIYFSILAVIYAMFFKRPKWNLMTGFVFVLFNQGFFILMGESARIPKLIISLLIIGMAIVIGFRIPRKVVLLSGLFYLFSILFFLNFYYYNLPILLAVMKYYNYLIPFLLFSNLRASNLSEQEWDGIAKFILTLITFQSVFSVVKLFVIGYLEGIIGSVTIAGGSMAVTLPLVGLLFYWIHKNEVIKGKDWYFVGYILIIGVASLKRAIWFIYPILLGLLLLKSASFRRARTVAYASVLIPLVFYVGLRSNPTLNPEGIVWGSFDPEFALNYALDYSGVSEEKRESDLAQGRWGASWALVMSLDEHFFSAAGLLGLPSERSGYLDSEEFVAEDFGLKHGTMVSGIGTMILKHGYIASLIILLIYIYIIMGVPNRFMRGTLLTLLFWNVFIYSGGFISTPTQAMLFIMVCEYARVKYYAKSLRVQQRRLAEYDRFATKKRDDVIRDTKVS